MLLSLLFISLPWTSVCFKTGGVGLQTKCPVASVLKCSRSSSVSGASNNMWAQRWSKGTTQMHFGDIILCFCMVWPKEFCFYLMSLSFYVNTVCETYTGLVLCKVLSMLFENKMWFQRCYHSVHVATDEGGLCFAAAVVSHMCFVSVVAMCSYDIHIRAQRVILLCLWRGPVWHFLLCSWAKKLTTSGFLLLVNSRIWRIDLLHREKLIISTKCFKKCYCHMQDL